MRRGRLRRSVDRQPLRDTLGLLGQASQTPVEPLERLLLTEHLPAQVLDSLLLEGDAGLQVVDPRLRPRAFALVVPCFCHRSALRPRPILPDMFDLRRDEDGKSVLLRGRFEASDGRRIAAALEAAVAGENPRSLRWDLRGVEALDTTTALRLWNRWGRERPAELALAEAPGALFERLASLPAEALDHPFQRPREGRPGGRRRWLGIVAVLGRFVLDLLLVLRRPRELPWHDLSAAAYRASVTALPIVAVVGVLIGIVLSYLSSLQLRAYGAESFLPLILGIGVVRELGPMLAAIVIAGRSGSSITAGLAAMRLTQELDALAAFGISHSLRLVLPRTLALAVTLPLLVVCTNLAALAGGMLSGWAELDLGPRAFVLGLVRDVSLGHVLIGLFKATVFGIAIGLIACQAGLAARADTQSLAEETTRSVVLSISTIILLDAIFAILFKDLP